jgi:hypothetical protein
MLKLSHNLFAFLFISLQTFAQMPDTDIWLFKLERDKDHRPVLKEGRNITNRKGYDNQPSFSEDGKSIYFSSVREDLQSDIYSCHLKSGKITPITKSLESEYSPVLMKGSNLLSAVVVEKDSSQRIHFIQALTGQTIGKLPIDSIGYTVFINEDTLAYFKLTAPQSLRYYVRSTGEDRFIGLNPIRSLVEINRHVLLYGLKDSTSTTYYHYDFLLRKAIKICRVEGLSEDVIYDGELGLLRSEKSRILRYDSERKEWEVLYDLKLFGIESLARFRLDLHRKHLIVVQINPS